MSDRVPLKIPKVSMAAEEVTFIEWLIDDGATVNEGDPLYSLATDKGGDRRGIGGVGTAAAR